MYAERLVALGKFATANGRRNIEPVLDHADNDTVRSLLLPIYGVGPKVVANFLALRCRSTSGNAHDQEAE